MNDKYFNIVLRKTKCINTIILQIKQVMHYR